MLFHHKIVDTILFMKSVKYSRNLFFLLFCLPVITFSKEVPVRLDIHLAGGVAYPWADLRDFFPLTAILDIDGKALLKKSAVQKKVARKYRRFLGDEIYIGHLLIPNTLAFSYSGKHEAWDAYIDWNLIGLNLLKYPGKHHYSAPFSFRFTVSLMAAYHVLSINSIYLHSPRIGLQGRINTQLRIVKNLSLKFFIFQNGYIPDTRTVSGRKRNIMPHYSAAGAGVIIHLYTRKKLQLLYKNLYQGVTLCVNL